MEFFTTPDQYLDIVKKNQSISSDFTSKYVESFEKISQLNIDYCKSNFDKLNQISSKYMGVKDPQDFTTITKTEFSSLQEDFTDYFKSVYKINSKLVKDVSELSEINSSEFNKYVSESVAEFSKNAPAGSEGIVEMTKSSIAASTSTYDALSNAAKQVFELVENNVEAASKTTSKQASVSQPAPKTTRSRKAA
ncbi:MAG: hypothetical protein CBC01_07270 [Betaproteobacteria bacterium TMED41]|nr:MAG: hypothetical protein CBC01_07270 [Betaproteobacteria bacterium TMED41]